MKIRNRRLVAAVGWLGSQAVQLLHRSLRFTYHPLGPRLNPAAVPPGGRMIYSMWHENLLLPTIGFGDQGLAVLISQHADGQVLGSLITAMGMHMVRGSTTRGGVEAVRQLTHPDAPWTHLAVTPDGPRGPRRVVQLGIIYVASRTGMKIVPIGVGYHRPWRAGSWDRFAVPRPFSRAVIVTSEAVAVPGSLRVAELEPHRRRVQAEMDRLNAIAEHVAETGKFDPGETAAGEATRLAG